MAKVYRDRLIQYGISQPQFFLLIALYEEDDILITRLSEKVALDKSTLTGILDRLERGGFVKRVSRPENRRSLYICLTVKAQTLRNDLTQVYNETNQLFFSRLSEHERGVFDEVMRKLEVTSDD